MLQQKTRFKKWLEFCHHTSIQKFYLYKDLIHNIRGSMVVQCDVEQFFKSNNHYYNNIFLISMISISDFGPKQTKLSFQEKVIMFSC